MSQNGEYLQGDGLSSNGGQANRRTQPQDNSWISFEIYVPANQTELLQGLDQWLKLNLISEAQVKKICRQNLSCVLPETKEVKNIPDIESSRPKTSSKTTVATSVAKVTPQPNIISQLWQGFLDELSIRWLLFLGIFLVVISSGVLAASQWENFPRFGQYFILLIYTLVFWGVGFWSNQQDNLKLTSQTLRAIATLLVPINFWAISQFRLGNNILEWITIAIALTALSSISFLQFSSQKSSKHQYFLPFFLLLSFLHLGWQLNALPTIAIYGGIAVISLIHYVFLLPKQKYPTTRLLFLFAAWLLLLLRELLTNEILISNYLLAIALCGWLLGTIWLTTVRKGKIVESKEEQTEVVAITNAFLSNICQIISLIILIGTWLLSLVAGTFQSSLFFWQTVGISIVAIHLFGQRLTLYWRKRDLTAIFFIGLQTLYISKELIPQNLRTDALDLSTKISQTEYFPESVFGVTLFPYVILFVFVASWLYSRRKSQLALYAEYLTLFLGITLTCLSFSNPTWRSLNFLFSTITLGYIVWVREGLRIHLIYITHILGLVTITNAIAVMLPNLNPAVWGSVFTALAILELAIYLHQAKQPRVNFYSNRLSILKHSCWYVGLLLGTISYTCFLAQLTDTPSLTAYLWGLVWFLIPGMFTIVARYTRKIKQRRLATSLSCLGLVTAQLLVLGEPVTRFIGLAIAIVIMLANAYHLRRTIITVIHLGFGLSLIASLVEGFITTWNWLVVGAVIILGLYYFRQYLQKTLDTPKFSYISQRNAHGILGVGVETRNFKLIEKYIQAIDFWAIALITVELALLSVIYLNLTEFKVYAQYLLTTILITGAIIWRYYRQPNHRVLFGLVWLIELLLAGLIVSAGGNSEALAVANIILGLSSLVFMSRVARSASPWAELNLSYISLVYGALGMLWRFSLYDAYSGILTLGIAVILINSRQSNNQLNLITNYLGFAGISLGIYELVIYQMQQSSGGSAADGLTILALVAAAIAFGYRSSAWWYRQHHQSTIFELSLPRIILIAHIHWAISSIFKILAASIAIESTTPRLTTISIATSFCLGAYALIQGKDNFEDTTPNPANDWWVYVGLVEIAATLVYSRLIINRLSLFDPWRVIFTCAIALAIYQIPWQNLGWRAAPWRRVALIIPALMALVTAEDISYFSLGITAIFYLRIAYHQKNLRWSYVSLGFINWGIIRLVWQFNTEFIWLAGMIGLSILYIAQFDPHFQSHRQQRHYLRLIGSCIICVAALFYQDQGVIPSVISFSLIFIGLGLKIRAFLFAGTITLILTVIYQLIILVLAYSFLKWIVGLLTGICTIIVAAGFEKQRELLTNRLETYANQLQNWQ